MFTIDSEIVNNIPSDVVAVPGAGGTTWSLSLGTYLFHYEMSLTSAGSVGLYVGPNSGSMALDGNSVAGSTTATTWISGQSAVVVSSTPTVVGLSSVVGTAAVTTAGSDASRFMIRMTIIKLS